MNIPTVRPSEVHHFYKLIKEGSLSETEFADIWSDSIKQAVEAAMKEREESARLRALAFPSRLSAR